MAQMVHLWRPALGNNHGLERQVAQKNRPPYPEVAHNVALVGHWLFRWDLETGKRVCQVNLKETIWVGVLVGCCYGT